jgi:alcohol dehydrogenase
MKGGGQLRLFYYGGSVSIFEFTIPTRIEFGIDAINRLGHFVNELGNRVLLVAENALSRAGIVHNVETILKGKGIESILYDAVFPQADSTIVDEIALIARKSKVNVVIGLGGSRTCNIAKLVAFLRENEGDISDFIRGKEGNGRRVPYIEIPTSFREVFSLTSSAYVNDAYDQSNKVITLKGLGTNILIGDPGIMSIMPLKTAVYVALDILTLSMEGYVSLKVNPLVEPVLLRGVEIVYYSLMSYIKNPHDVTIREKLCTAGLFTAIANIITGFGIGFALSMGMNGKKKISKSILTSILLPFIMEYNLSVAASRIAKIGRVMGKDMENLPETKGASIAVKAIREFKENLGIEIVQRIGQLGLAKDDLAEVAEAAIRFEDINSVPRKASFENLMEILERAY